MPVHEVFFKLLVEHASEAGCSTRCHDIHTQHGVKTRSCTSVIQRNAEARCDGNEVQEYVLDSLKSILRLILVPTPCKNFNFCCADVANSTPHVKVFQ